jgi:hypothetical protein
VIRRRHACTQQRSDGGGGGGGGACGAARIPRLAPVVAEAVVRFKVNDLMLEDGEVRF